MVSSKETDALLGGQRDGGKSSSERAEEGDAGSEERHASLNASPKCSRAIYILMACVLVVALSLMADLCVYLIHRHRIHKQQQPSADLVDATSRRRRNSKYRATQLISFTINTLGGSDAHGECEGRDVDPSTGQCYLGNTHNLAEDVHHRARIVEEVLQKLKNDVFREEPAIDRNSNVLKIVMLPEFYWRGPYGAYSIHDLYDDTQDNSKDGILIQVGDRLRKIVADDAFADYLFVGGTVLAAQPADPDMNLTQALQDAHDILYYNFANIIKGGTAYMVQKRYISGADFLSRSKLPNPSDEDLHRYGDASMALQDTLQKRGNIVVPHNVLEIDGIRIGFEICLDHRMGQLWNSIQQYEKGQLVDVQLITSAGMAIERGPNPVVPGGVVYLCDGEASSAACLRTDEGIFDPDNVCRGKPKGIKHIPVGGPGYSNFLPLSSCWDMEASEYLTGYYSLHQTQGCAYTLKLYGVHVMDKYKYYPPSIEIYPTVNLPGVE